MKNHSFPKFTQAALEVVVVSGAEALAPFVPAWQELADSAGEPNVFYEPWLLLPALQAFAPTPAPEFHLIFASGTGTRASRLCGVFPLVRERRYKGMRVSILRLWKPPYCALCTPLIRRGCEAPVMAALLDHLHREPRGASLLELGEVSGDGPFGRALVEVFGERGTTTFVDEAWTRAVLRPRPGEDGEAYLQRAISSKRRKELRRQEKRLSESGPVRYARLEHETDPALEAYLAEFLRVEASGWKAETGSAFACDPAHSEFFRVIVTQAHHRGRLRLATLRVGDDVIAVKCDLWAQNGAFAFKIGYDERFASFSPGVLLELEGIRQLHQQLDPQLNPIGSLRWMDSCAVRNHPMINRLWRERRALQTVVIATGRGRGALLVASLALLRHLKTAVRRKRRGSNRA